MNFSPLRNLRTVKEMISNEVDQNCTKLNVLMAFLAQNVWDLIAVHINERLVTCYNNLPHIHMYWSKHYLLVED